MFKKYIVSTFWIVFSLSAIAQPKHRSIELGYVCLGEASQPGVITYKGTAKWFSYSPLGNIHITMCKGPSIDDYTHYYKPNGSLMFFNYYTDSLVPLFAPEIPCTIVPDLDVRFKRIQSGLVDLPQSDSSYFFLELTCCRSDDFTNIDNGEVYYNRGFIVVTELTPLGQQLCNSTPDFQEDSYLTVCVGDTFSFDQSAFDPDGDQLIYELSHPWSAQFDSTGFPLFYFLPPYPLAPYLTPEYTYLTPLGPSSEFSINPTTGELTGYASEVGKYLCGISVSDYYNGQYLSTLHRDIVLNVIPCTPKVYADIAADSITPQGDYFIRGCNTTDLQLTNLSQHPDSITDFFWLIDGQLYTDWDPLLVNFPGSGIYTGALFLNPGQECADTAQLVFHIVEEMTADFTFEYDTCVSGPVSLNAQVQYDGAGPLHFHWSFGTNQTSTLSDPVYYYDNPGTYDVSLTVSDEGGCRDSVIYPVHWQPAPAIIVVSPNQEAGCVPLTVGFNNRSWPVDSTYTVIWNFGDNQTQQSIHANHLYLQPGTYDVGLSITSPIGCSVDTIFPNLIRADPPPQADFTWQPRPVTEYTPEVRFHDRSEHAAFWQWHFDKSNDSEALSFSQHPVHVFPDTGIWQVSLIAFDEYGCSDTLRQSLVVEPVLNIHFPNAFTPNGDGLNDEFRATGTFTALASWQLSIYNRYGEMVFSNNDPTIGWNGRKHNTGKPAPAGTYVYQLAGVDIGGERLQKEGVVVLVR